MVVGSGLNERSADMMSGLCQIIFMAIRGLSLNMGLQDGRLSPCMTVVVISGLNLTIALGISGLSPNMTVVVNGLSPGIFCADQHF